MALNLRTTLILLALAALVGATLAACGIGLGAAGVTTPPAPTLPPAATTPFAPATAMPLPVTTPVPQPPTAAPTAPPGVGFTPDVTLSPAQGAPGTVITVTGRRFGPEPVTIRVAAGPLLSEVLAVAQPDANSAFQATITLPDRLGGQPIPAGPLMVIAAVEQAQLNIGTQFTVVAAPAPVPATPREAVDMLLAQASADLSLRGALPYLGPDLRARVQAGQLDAGSLLIMQNPFTSYVIDQEYGDTQGNLYVDARLFFGGATTGGAGRIFRLSSAEGSWKVEGVSDASVIPPPPPAWPGPGWALHAEADLTGDGVAESVYCAPSGIAPQVSYGDPQLDAAATVCAEVMIASPPATPGGDHAILLRATQKDLVAADGILGSFASSAKPDGAAAHRLAVTPGAKVAVHLLPLAPDGTAHAQGVGVYWNAADGAFRFAGPDVWGTP